MKIRNKLRTLYYHWILRKDTPLEEVIGGVVAAKMGESVFDIIKAQVEAGKDPEWEK